MRFFFLLCLLLQHLLTFAQQEKVFRITSSHTSFPDTGRATGHVYNQVSYLVAGHYDDSSVLIVVPPDYKAGKKTDIIFWFHGWRNNIDSVVSYFEIAKQFLAAKRNAILVIPESAKNSPDSYGGKLERINVFKGLVEDVLMKLKKEKVISKSSGPGNLLLAGHSGAFRVMAFILQKGGLPVSQVILFDGLYSQVDKYTHWIQADTTHRFIHLYTNKGGGTDQVSTDMMKGLLAKNLPFVLTEESAMNTSLLRSNRVVFIHSPKEHNNVINLPDHNFRFLLENSPVLKVIK